MSGEFEASETYPMEMGELEKASETYPMEIEDKKPMEHEEEGNSNRKTEEDSIQLDNRAKSIKESTQKSSEVKEEDKAVEDGKKTLKSAEDSTRLDSEKSTNRSFTAASSTNRSSGMKGQTTEEEAVAEPEKGAGKKRKPKQDSSGLSKSEELDGSFQESCRKQNEDMGQGKVRKPKEESALLGKSSKESTKKSNEEEGNNPTEKEENEADVEQGKEGNTSGMSKADRLKYSIEESIMLVSEEAKKKGSWKCGRFDIKYIITIPYGVLRSAIIVSLETFRKCDRPPILHTVKSGR